MNVRSCCSWVCKGWGDEKLSRQRAYLQTKVGSNSHGPVSKFKSCFRFFFSIISCQLTTMLQSAEILVFLPLRNFQSERDKSDCCFWFSNIQIYVYPRSRRLIIKYKKILKIGKLKKIINLFLNCKLIIFIKKNEENTILFNQYLTIFIIMWK